MIICQVCNALLPDTAIFCGNCGKEVVVQKLENFSLLDLTPKKLSLQTISGGSVKESNPFSSSSPPLVLKQEIPKSIEIFISYAKRDQKLRDQLETHLSNLKYRGLINTWNVGEIDAGDDIIQQIDIHLNTAHIILLLLSANFLASEHCYGREMVQAVQRHKQGVARVIPILLRPVVFTDAPFAGLQSLPTNGKSVVNWRNRDSAFVDIAIGIEYIVQEMINPISPPEYPRLQISISSGGIGNSFINELRPNQSTGLLINAPRPKLRRSRRSRAVLVGLSLIGLLFVNALFVLLAHYPKLIPIVGVIIGSLILLVGIFLTILALVKRAQSRATQRQEQQRQEQQRQERQRQKQQRRLYEKELMKYEQEMHLHNTPGFYKGKGDILIELERYDEAVVAYEQAIALDALYTNAYFAMSRALSRLERIQEAELTRAKAKQLREAERQGQEQHWQAQAERQRQEQQRQEQRRQEQREQTYYVAALTAYERALHKGNTDATAYRGKGNALVGLKRYSEALTAFEQGIALDPLPITYVNIGDVFVILERYAEAVAAYEQALALDASYASAYFGMSKALSQLGRVQEAEQSYEQAKQLGDDDQDLEEIPELST